MLKFVLLRRPALRRRGWKPAKPKSRKTGVDGFGKKSYIRLVHRIFIFPERAVFGVIWMQLCALFDE